MELPADLYHLLFAELSDRLDFDTLYNCVVSSKHLASNGAVKALYRISHQAPVKGGGEGLPPAEQELTVQRWSILWRSITLSACGATMFPYCRHLKFLDLRDLGDLLDDDKFRGKIADNFFEGQLSKFCYNVKVTRKWQRSKFDTPRIITAIGTKIISEAPLLEVLSEPTNSTIFNTALLIWLDRLENLKMIEFWDGRTLENKEIRSLLHTHCKSLSSLRIYYSSHSEADHHFASFIGDMRENGLTHFENIRNCHIGPETCLALNHHGKSLTSLKLGVTVEGMQGVALLQGCTAIQTLAIECLTACPDLKSSQHDVYLDIIGWLKDCTALQDISITNIVSAPDLMIPVLLNKDIKLEKLQIKAQDDGAYYPVKDHHDFHQALSQQTSLRSLLLWADADPGTRDDNEYLMNAFCRLQELRELRLTRVADWFTDEHIVLLAQHLHKLEDVYIGGYHVSDAVFPDLAKLSNLGVITFSGVTAFTENGILDFIERLGEGNSGLVLSIDNADPDSGLSPESQDLIRDVMSEKLNGRFEYQYLRDPNVPEFDSDDSD